MGIGYPCFPGNHAEGLHCLRGISGGPFWGYKGSLKVPILHVAIMFQQVGLRNVPDGHPAGRAQKQEAEIPQSIPQNPAATIKPTPA